MRVVKKLIVFGVLISFFSCSQKPTEVIETTWPDGSPQKVVYYEVQKSDSIKVREERFYESGDQEMVGGYNGIKKEGDWMYWFADGKKWSQATYANDLKEGEAIVWRDNGNKNYEGGYATGKPHGSWIFYDVDGSRMKEVLFEYGQKVNEIAFKEQPQIEMPTADSVQVTIGK